MTHLSLNYIVAICIWANEELPLASRIDLYRVWGGGGGGGVNSVYFYHGLLWQLWPVVFVEKMWR